MKKKGKKGPKRLPCCAEGVNLKDLTLFTCCIGKASAFSAQPFVCCASLTWQGSTFLARGWEWNRALGRQSLGQCFPLEGGGAALGNQENTERSMWTVGSEYTQRRDDPQLSPDGLYFWFFIFVSFSEPGSQHVAQGGL